MQLEAQNLIGIETDSLLTLCCIHIILYWSEKISAQTIPPCASPQSWYKILYTSIYNVQLSASDINYVPI